MVEGRMAHLTNGVLVVCAVVLTVLAVRREVRSGGRPAGDGAPRRLASWQTLLRSGHLIGDPRAKVHVVEFGDFECPACGALATGGMRAILSEYPHRVDLDFHHWPLPYHKLAYPAARASECVAAQGKFEQFYTLVYEKQDSLGLKPLREFARDAGVQDLAAFDSCNAHSSPVATIEADRNIADSIGASGTPTVIIDGMLYPSAPDSAQLERIIAKLVADGH